MGLQHFYTHIIIFSWGFQSLTFQPGFRFSLAMHIFGLHSPSKCWIFKVFVFSILIFHGVFLLLTLQPGFRFSLSLLNGASLSPPRPPVAMSLGPHVEFKISPCHMPLRSPCRSLYSIKRQPGSPLFLELCSKNTVTGFLF